MKNKIKGYNPDVAIVEKKLKIPASYQYKAIRSNNFLQANWHRNKYFVLRKLIKFNKNMNVLDLGTGSGNFEILFCKKVGKITGVDYNSEALLFLNNYLIKRNINNVNLIQTDIRKLSQLKKLPKFDLITIIDVIEHLNEADSKEMVRAFRRLLKKDGKICVVTPNYKSLWYLIEQVLDRASVVPKFTEAQHLSRYHKENLNSIFRNNGFKTDKISSFNLFSFVFPNSQVCKFLCGLELKFPFMLGNLIVGVFSPYR
jgi:ubiquinone/menaquinone biosynthesis C-methylase UbiE